MRSRHDTAAPGHPRNTGFSLVEVMVALVVMSVGLLGVAKMQALALSSTTTSRMRSLAALEASSLASTMRADRAYWSLPPVDPAVVITNGVITSTGGGSLLTISPTPVVCPCSPQDLAMNDLTEWVTDLNKQVPNVSGTVSCPVPAPTTPPTPAPISCQISINWVEAQVASNAQQVTQAQSVNTPVTTSFILHVDP
jgi:type IV pilus assembly protein PilV